MGQIVGINSDIFRCNISAIQTGGSKANVVLAADEVWLISTANSLTSSGSGDCDAYIIGNGTTAATDLELKSLGSDAINYGEWNSPTSDAVFKAITISTPIAPVNMSGLTVSWNGTVSSVSASYFINYYEAIIDCDVAITFTRANSYTNDGRVFTAESSSEIAVGESVTRITQVAEGDTYQNIFHLTAGQCLGVTNRASDTFSFALVTTLKKTIEDVANDVEQKYNTFKKHPKEGVNLIELASIQENKIVSDNGNFITYNGWRGIEIDFCSTEAPIFLNLIYSGYYSLLDAEGNVVKMVQNSNRDLFSGFKLPSGVVKGRFSINNTETIEDINAYAYISYGRPLMQDEINVRVGYDDSYTMYKIERPTDYNWGDIAAFSNILCIGDSITDGYFNYNAISGQTFTMEEKYSYPSNLARMTGCNVINLGDSGESSYSWWDAHKNDSELTGASCAIIELGINDAADTLDTLTKDAFDNIISALKSRNKNIKIFISGIISGKSYKANLATDAYYAKDQWLRNYYNTYFANDTQVYFLDIARYGHIRDKYSKNNFDDYNKGHLSAYGYWRLAKDYANYISYIMRLSDKDFGNIQFTGTDFVYP